MPSQNLSTYFRFNFIIFLANNILLLVMAQQKMCPVRIFSNELISAKNNKLKTAGNTENPLQQGQGQQQHYFDPPGHQSGSTEVPGANNTAVLFSDHYEPDSESSLTANFKCQFIFVGAPEERVQIIFHQFRLRQHPLLATNSRRQMNNTTTARCEENDHLSAHVLLGDRMSKIHDFCGDELPAQLMSAKNVLTLTYVLKSALMPSGDAQRRHWAAGPEGEVAENAAGAAGSSRTHFGWVAEYRFIRDFGVQPAEAIPQGDGSVCSFVFNGSVKATGNVWSPNYPGFYPRNVDCQYVFIGGKEGQQVYITFEYFDVEGFGHCEENTQSDYLLFSNYKTRDRTNRRFCGMLRPRGAVQSESSYFRMHFHTNGIFDGTGFYARYQFLNEKPSKSRVKLAPSNNGYGLTPKLVTIFFSFINFIVIYFIGFTFFA